MEIKLEPQYEVIKQKPYCCVPACISMILRRRRIPHGSQEEIGYELGLTVPEEYAGLFKKVRTGEKPTAGYGTQVQKEEYSINNYFRKNRMPLKEEYCSIRKIENIKEFIFEKLKANNDLIVCFNNKSLYGNGDWGHVSLIEHLKGDEVILIEPEPDLPERRQVSLKDLINAMEVHGENNMGGFWIVSD